MTYNVLTLNPTHSLTRSLHLRNDLYCVEWDVKLYYTIPYHTIPLTRSLTCIYGGSIYPINWAIKRATYGRWSIHGASFTSRDSAVSLALGARRSCDVCRRTPDRSRCHTRHWPTEDCEFHSQNSSATDYTRMHTVVHSEKRRCTMVAVITKVHFLSILTFSNQITRRSVVSI